MIGHYKENCRGVFDMDYFDLWLPRYLASIGDRSETDRDIEELKAAMTVGKQQWQAKLR